jgi:hypothetical protein
VVDDVRRDPSAVVADQQRPIVGGGRVRPIRSPQVLADRAHRRRTQRQLARFVELSRTDDDHTRDRIEIAAIERDRLTAPHPGRGEQTNQRAQRRRPMWRAQRPAASISLPISSSL